MKSFQVSQAPVASLLLKYNPQVFTKLGKRVKGFRLNRMVFTLQSVMSQQPPDVNRYFPGFLGKNTDCTSEAKKNNVIMDYLDPESNVGHKY